MKPQDIVFIALVVILFVWRRKPVWFVGSSIGLLLLAIPLYMRWIFFTAERMVWYAALLLFLSILMQIYYARES